MNVIKLVPELTQLSKLAIHGKTDEVVGLTANNSVIQLELSFMSGTKTLNIPWP